MIRTLPFLISLALTVYCLIDAIQTDEIVMRNLPKMAWVFIILLFPVIVRKIIGPFVLQHWRIVHFLICFVAKWHEKLELGRQFFFTV